MLNENRKRELIAIAMEQLKYAYTPYSNFKAVSYTHLTLPTNA